MICLYSETGLTELFIKEFLKINELELRNNMSTKEYGIQIGTKLVDRSSFGVVVGITDETMNNEKYRIDSYIEKATIPDAMIRLNNLTILIEAKIENGKIDNQQMRDHEKMFANNEEIKPPVFCSWQQIYVFLEGITKRNSYNSLTNFLLEQFLAFCENMGLSPEKTENYIYTYFSDRPKVLATIVKIHEYLTNMDDVYFNKPITDCFGYKIIKSNNKKNISTTNKFFTSTIYKNGTYVFHLMTDIYAFELQQRIDKTFKGNKKFNKGAAKEAHINMDLVDNFEQIKPYIDIAYNDRKNSI